MLLATVLLPLALAPQAAAAPTQEPPPPVAQEPATPAPQEPAPAVQATDMPASPAAATHPHVDAGLAAFKKHRFAAARDEFEKAVTADPQSAAAHFYLGYSFYKLGEPSKRMNENKEKAKQEFAKAFDLDPTFEPVWGSKK
jgi:Tfp pilus assembly protein PilF